ncbi:MAG: CpXC domain-containing protein [Rubrivivax sp.]
MSLMHPYAVTDRQGQRRTAMLADCLNVQRTPVARQRILDRSLHRVQSGGAALQVEKAFFYLDLARGQAFLVQPPRERFRHAQASAQLERMLAVLPEAMRKQAALARVVYGLEELREKIVAAEAGLDDRAVELMKAAVVHDHPVLLTRARLRLALDRVDAQGAQFLAQYDHSPKAFTVTYATPELFCNDEKSLQGWAATLQRHDVYKLEARGEHWVNYRRWLPSQDAVAQLHEVVRALDGGKPPKPASTAFKSLLARLPRGSALSGQGKQDLRRLFLWAKKSNQQKLQDQLFELRFGVALEDSWYRNDDKNDIDTLWRLLKNLPDSHVEGNAKLAEISLDLGGGGGSYSPGSMEIEIGSTELVMKERFEDTLRHEVGHAVHEAHADLINGWLWEQFGWASFEPTQAGIDDWVALMGAGSGWAALNNTQKTQMRALIRQACGEGSVWKPTVTPNAPVGSAWRDNKNFGPRLAFERSGENWYEHHAGWYRAGQRAFAVNFWYGTLMCVKVSTLDFISERMPDNYAAMSPGEFFAELYAVVYDSDDPRRKKLPAELRKFFDTTLAQLAPGKAPPMPKSLVGAKARPGHQAGKGRPT